MLPFVTQAYQLWLSIMNVIVLDSLFWDSLGEFSEHIMIILKKMWLELRHTEINVNFLSIAGIAFTDLPVR